MPDTKNLHDLGRFVDFIEQNIGVCDGPFTGAVALVSAHIGEQGEMGKKTVAAEEKPGLVQMNVWISVEDETDFLDAVEPFRDRARKIARGRALRRDYSDPTIDLMLEEGALPTPVELMRAGYMVTPRWPSGQNLADVRNPDDLPVIHRGQGRAGRYLRWWVGIVTGRFRSSGMGSDGGRSR